MIDITLNGKLGKKFGRKWKLDASSVAEALHAIDVLKGGFFAYIEELESEMQGYHIKVGKEDIGEEKLALQIGNTTVRITPLLQGTDTKGVLQIVAGVAIIAIGIATAGYTGPFAASIVGLGLAVALGGVARLLMNSPQQPLATQEKHKASYVFTGSVNTTIQGECVPVAYGNPFTGSAVTQAGMEAVDVNN